jgi:diacylglycerol kinase (ATP)
MDVSPNGRAASVDGAGNSIRPRASFSPLLAVLNPIAGARRHDGFSTVVERLRAKRIDVVVRMTSFRGHAEQMARSAGAEGFAMVMAAGGDGTVNEVINGLAESPLPLAVYPLGTTNVLAAEIGMPRDPAAFVDKLEVAEPGDAWLGEISGRRFSVAASVGFDSRVVEGINETLKRRIGKGAYVYAALGQMIHNDPASYRVTIDGSEYLAAGVVIAKGRYYAGRFLAAPGARITDPRLQVCLLEGGRRVDILRYATALFGGFLWRLGDVRIIDAQEVVIASNRCDPVQGDGDIVVRLPAIARVSASPLKLVMGQSHVLGRGARLAATKEQSGRSAH